VEKVAVAGALIFDTANRMGKWSLRSHCKTAGVILKRTNEIIFSYHKKTTCAVAHIHNSYQQLKNFK